MPDAPEPTFSQALEELEDILSRIESEEIDIDALAAELRRGTELLDLCRGKIRKADLEVTQIVQRLEQAESATAAGLDAGEDDDEDAPF